MRSETRRLVLALALSLALPFAAGCSQKQPTSSPEPKASEAPAAEEEPDKDRKKDPEAELQELQNEGATESTTDSTATPATGNKIGAAGIGFVTVPDSWKEFHDVDGNSSIQWCDGTPYTVISLNTVDTSGLSDEQRAEFDAEDAANSIWQRMLDDGVSEDAIQGARVKLAGRDALQVYGLYPDGSYLVCWLATDDAGTIRYVAAEGTENTIMDAVNIVQDTYEY